MKKSLFGIILIAFATTLCFAEPKPFNGKSAAETVKDMKTGWNLGNTFDAPSETAWSQPKTSKAMFDALSASGIKTIRIPVSWSSHVSGADYTINEAWMNRVKEVVDGKKQTVYDTLKEMNLSENMRIEQFDMDMLIDFSRLFKNKIC